MPATVMTADLLASGDIDFDLEDGFDYLPLMDAGKPCTILAESIWDALNCAATTASSESLTCGARK